MVLVFNCYVFIPVDSLRIIGLKLSQVVQTAVSVASKFYGGRVLA